MSPNSTFENLEPVSVKCGKIMPSRANSKPCFPASIRSINNVSGTKYGGTGGRIEALYLG